MDRCARRTEAAPGWTSAAIRPSASTTMSATWTLCCGSIVTTVPPRIASGGGALLTATVGGAGICRQQQRHVVVPVSGIDVEVDGHALQERSRAVLASKIGGHVEDQTVDPRLQRRTIGQVGNAAVGVC